MNVDPDFDIDNVAEQPRLDASTLILSGLISVIVEFRVTVCPFVAAVWVPGYAVGLAVTAGFVVSNVIVLELDTAIFPAVSLT